MAQIGEYASYSGCLNCWQTKNMFFKFIKVLHLQYDFVFNYHSNIIYIIVVPTCVNIGYLSLKKGTDYTTSQKKFQDP